MILALDSETTGRDFWHGAKPFLVTTCDEAGEVLYWEWDVDPRTREPQIPVEDLEEIDGLIQRADLIVGQNLKFDVHALKSIGIVDFPWAKARDTLLAGHLLASNQPHDLTSMASLYLGRNIAPAEQALEAAVKKCRNWCQHNRPDWAIAREGRPDMPSAGGKRVWAADYWLPRAVAAEQRLPADHPWWTVTAAYANTDSPVTLLLWKVMEQLIHQQGLWPIYEERLKLLPISWRMEDRGLTLSRPRLEELERRYRAESSAAGERCVALATLFEHPCPECAGGHAAAICTVCNGAGRAPYRLEMPKGASPNGSLRRLCFDVMGLEHVRDPKAKTAEPSLGKTAMTHYQETLPPHSKQLKFVRTLAAKRKRDSYLGYMAQYRKFCRPAAGGMNVLHPNLNPTGTDTLRWSHSNPNEANISKQGLYEGDPYTLRYLFGPGPGREWYSFDAKNIELRLPAYRAGEQELIDLFEKADQPPYYGSEHLLNFSTVYPDVWAGELGKVCNDCCKGRVVDLTNVGPHCKKKFASTWYQRCKNGDFAVGYGAVDRPDGLGTADRTFGRPGSHAKLKARFAKKEALNQHYIRQAERLGYVETFVDRSLGCQRGYPVMCTRTEHGRIRPTVPLNYAIQSTAMQWTNKAMIRVDEFFEHLNAGGLFAGRRWPGGYYIVIQQHDELVCDMPAGAGRGPEPWDYNRPVTDEVMRLMAKGGEDIGVPTPVGREYHASNWAQGVSV